MFGKDFVALLSQREIFFGYSSFVMRGELQRYFIKTNLDIRMVIHFLRFPGDPVDKIDALQEASELKGSRDCPSPFRPIRDGS